MYCKFKHCGWNLFHLGMHVNILIAYEKSDHIMGEWVIVF